MAEPTTRTGSCHCGKVRFEVKTDLSKVIACNCSICSRLGWLLTYVPAERFTLLSGDDQLSEYQFGKKRAHHLFCRVCGVHPFSHGKAADGKDMHVVNVRCLEGVDVGALTVTPFDGKSL